jgi:hypothetical protein
MKPVPPLVIVVFLLGGCLDLPAELPERSPGPDATASDVSSRDGQPGDATDENGPDTDWRDAGGEPLRFKSVSAGQAHACAVAEDDTLWCWGQNGEDQVTPEQDGDITAPIRVAPGGGIGSYATVATGNNHTCALYADDQGVVCWGDNTVGQKNGDDSYQVVLQGTPNARLLRAGSHHTCLVTGEQGELTCWGADGGYAIGNVDEGATFNDMIGPFTDPPIVDLGLGLDTSFVVDADGTVGFFGENGAASPPDDFATGGMACDETGSCAAPAVWEVDSFERVAIAETYGCGTATADRTLLCWGEELPPLPGLADSHAEPQPTEVQVDAGDFKVALGPTHACAIVDGDIRCWGFLGPREAPMRIRGDYFAVTAGDGFSCALEFVESAAGTDLGDLICWGVNSDGQLGVGNTKPQVDPVRLRIPGG